MTLTAFYFYQALYVLFSSLNHFSSCQTENKNKWREDKKHAQIHLSITSHGYTHLEPLINTVIPLQQVVTAVWTVVFHIVPFLLISVHVSITQC